MNPLSIVAPLNINPINVTSCFYDNIYAENSTVGLRAFSLITGVAAYTEIKNTYFLNTKLGASSSFFRLDGATNVLATNHTLVN